MRFKHVSPLFTGKYSFEWFIYRVQPRAYGRQAVFVRGMCLV